MRTLNPIRLALLAAAALFTHAAFAAKPGPTPPPPPPPPSSGALVLDYEYLENPNSAENFGLTVAPSGTIYSAGTSYNPPGVSPGHGIVLASSDGGSTWSLVDDFVLPGFNVSYSCGIVSDAAGNLYVAGSFVEEATQFEHWIVRRSTDGGANWTTVDDFDQGTDFGGLEPPTGIAVDAAGDVYVSGRAKVAGTTTWTVRKGVGGTSFSTVDVFMMPGSYPKAYPQAIFAHPTAGIFVAGNGNIVIRNKASAAWVVRRSTNGGATWQTVETFQISSGNAAGAFGIGADATDNLYVVGAARKPAGSTAPLHWIVRKSSDGGTSFSTVEDFGTNSSARQFAQTPNGDLYVAGHITTSSGVNQMIVRKSAGGTGAWSTIDGYQHPGFSYIEARSIAADSWGNLFVGAGSEAGLWIVKKY